VSALAEVALQQLEARQLAGQRGELEL